MRKAPALAQPSAIMASLTDNQAPSQIQGTSASARSFSIVSFRPFNKQRAPTYKQANYVDDAGIGEQLRRQVYSPDCERFAAVAGSFAFRSSSIVRLRGPSHLLAILTMGLCAAGAATVKRPPALKDHMARHRVVESRTMLRELMIQAAETARTETYTVSKGESRVRMILQNCLGQRRSLRCMIKGKASWVDARLLIVQSVARR